MMKKLPSALLLFFLAGITACSHSIHQVHAGGFDPYRLPSEGRLVSTSSEQWTFLGMVANTSYVDSAYEALQAECPKGTLEGITTQFSTSHGPLSWTNKVLLKGYCF